MFHERWTAKRGFFGNTRQCLRLKASWPVRYWVGSDFPRAQVTRAKNVNADGIAVVVQEEIQVGSRLGMELLVPPIERRIPAEGKVVRQSAIARDGYELGIRFFKIDPQDRQILNETIERFTPSRKWARHLESSWRKIR